MTLRVERYQLPREGGVLNGSFIQVLRATVEIDDWLYIDCEVDDALPPVAREFLVVFTGMAVPGKQRPRMMEIRTMGSEEPTLIETGEVEVLTPAYACPIDGAPNVYLYWMVAPKP